MPVVLRGQALPGLDGPISKIGSSSLSRSGIIAVSLSTNALGPIRDSLVSGGSLTPASYYLAGDPPANAAQLPETLHDPVGSDTVTLDGMIPDRAAEFHPALFAAFPVAADSIPPDDFEILGANDLPSGWPAFWTNTPGGGVGLHRPGTVTGGTRFPPDAPRDPTRGVQPHLVDPGADTCQTRIRL